MTIPLQFLCVVQLPAGSWHGLARCNMVFVNRNQTVRMGKDWSTRADLMSGIPQGSVLGPILFTSFINDFPECVESCCKVFADDSKIYSLACNCTKIQEDIYRLQEWSDMWNLYFDVTKCMVMYILGWRTKKLIIK